MGYSDDSSLLDHGDVLLLLSQARWQRFDRINKLAIRALPVRLKYRYNEVGAELYAHLVYLRQEKMAEERPLPSMMQFRLSKKGAKVKTALQKKFFLQEESQKRAAKKTRHLER